MTPAQIAEITRRASMGKPVDVANVALPALPEACAL